MKLFLEDGVGIVHLKLGFEVAESLGGGVGTTANVAQVVAQVFGLDAFASPAIALDLHFQEFVPRTLTSYRGLRRAS